MNQGLGFAAVSSIVEDIRRSSLSTEEDFSRMKKSTFSESSGSSSISTTLSSVSENSTKSLSGEKSSGYDISSFTTNSSKISSVSVFSLGATSTMSSTTGFVFVSSGLCTMSSGSGVFSFLFFFFFGFTSTSFISSAELQVIGSGFFPFFLFFFCFFVSITGCSSWTLSFPSSSTIIVSSGTASTSGSSTASLWAGLNSSSEQWRSLAVFLVLRMTGLSTIWPSTSLRGGFLEALPSVLPACTATENILVSAVTISTGLGESTVNTHIEPRFIAVLITWSLWRCVCSEAARRRSSSFLSLVPQ